MLAGKFYSSVNCLSVEALGRLAKVRWLPGKDWCKLAGVLLALSSLPLSPVVQAASCAVSDSTLSSARARFAQLCSTEVRDDCDYIGNRWYCSSERITNNILPAGLIGSTNAVDSQSSSIPSSTIDPVSAGVCIDSDGDGYGWNGATCLVAATNPVIPGTGPCLDSDGDGWGWNGESCLVSSVSSPPAASNNSSDSSVRASDITDLILLTGQSNALGASTAYDASLDSGGDHVFAFTDTGWQQADLNQVWDLGWYPRNDPATDPSNNLLLHFGKQVVSRDRNRVVGFVLVSAPGAAISHWDYNGEFYRTVRARVLDAINQLPHKSQLDGILWHQGETDAEDKDLYGSTLYALIDNFRSENWFANDRPFICGEIAKRGGVNNQLNKLNSDNDSSTACVSAANVETKSDNAHFTAVGLREIGKRYGDQYYQMTR